VNSPFSDNLLKNGKAVTRTAQFIGYGSAALRLCGETRRRERTEHAEISVIPQAHVLHRGLAVSYFVLVL
jgi:hypothetical protein